MSKYFAKYIPVEGKIKEGDVTRTPDGTLWNSINNSPNIEGTHKKVKLFLCSTEDLDRHHLQPS